MNAQKAENEEWRELKSPSKRDCPKVFYSFHIAQNGLSLYLTDLIAIWSCQMDRDEVVNEASDRHTSIDPSESSTQFDVLLTKLRQSLAGEKNYLGLSTADRSNVLVLRTVDKLPAPLRPLEWEFILRPQSAADISEQILRPCLHEVSVSQQKITSLQRIIAEKDHVLSRLLERVENSATDLSLIFPGITGLKSRRSHITVADASKHVPGIAAFDQANWESQFGEDGNESFDKLGLNKLVTGCEKCFVHSKEEHQDWVTRLPDSRTLTLGKEATSSDRSAPVRDDKQPKLQRKSTQGDDVFERQATPPQLKKPTRNKDHTDIDRSPSPPRRRNRIGALHRHDNTNDQHSPRVTASETKALDNKKLRRTSDNSTDVETASESSSDEDAKPPPSRPQTRRQINTDSSGSDEEARRTQKPMSTPQKPSSTASTPRHKLWASTEVDDAAAQPQSPSKSQASQARRLGRIGLKRADSSAAPASSQPSHTASNTSTPTHRLGRLTPKRASITPRKEVGKGDRDDRVDRNTPLTSTPSSRSASPTPGRAKALPETAEQPKPHTKPAPDPGPEPETAEQKANRRRLELKRAMNEEAGAKKKRRF